MKQTLERERKFEVEPDFQLARIGGQPLEDRTFSSTYYDTPDRRLTRFGLTLRRRVERGVGAWQLKLPHAGARLELEELGGPVVPSRIAGALAGVARGRALEPVATLRTHRSARLVDGVAVTRDEVEVLDEHGVVDRFTELEAELVDGETGTLSRVARRLVEIGAESAADGAKLLRVVEVPRRSGPSSHASTLERVRVYIGEQYEELLRTDPLVRLTDDADAVHDMRVAVRRLRSILRTVKRMLDSHWVDELRAELDWLGTRLGALRDLNVLAAGLQEEAATLSHGDAALGSPLLLPLREDEAQARATLVRALGKPRYFRLLDRLEAATEALPVRRDDLGVDEMAQREFRRLLRRGRKLTRLNDAALHKLRIQGKRARYAAELAEPVAGKRATRFVRVAQALQDVLGEHQDAVVAEKRLRQLAGAAGRSDLALVAGRLIERREHTKKQTREELPAVWGEVRRCGRKAWRGSR